MVIFAFFDEDGLTPIKEKRAESAEKGRCQACVPLLIEGKQKEGSFHKNIQFKINKTYGRLVRQGKACR